MTRRKLILKIVLCLLVPFSLSGCWSAQEINNLAIISAIGIDQNHAGDVVMTVSVIKPNNLFSQTAVIKEDDADSFLVETVKGKNLFDAMGKLSSALSEKVYLGHVNAVVFGERAARERMESSLDFFKRETDFRPNMLVFVGKGLAEKIIRSTPTLNPTPATEMHDLFQNNSFTAIKTVKDVSKFTESMTSNTIDPVTGVLSSAADQGIAVNSDSQPTPPRNNNADLKEQNIPKLISLTETAAFKGSKLVGYLNQSETRGLMWIRGELKDASLTLDCGNQHDSGTVSLQVRNSKSTMIPSDENRKMAVNIEADADIVEITCKNMSLDSRKLEALNKQFQDEIQEDALQALNKAQKRWETDIFGFGKAIYRKHPVEWDNLATIWRNGGLKGLDVTLKIHANISRYGLSTDPSKANESR